MSQKPKDPDLDAEQGREDEICSMYGSSGTDSNIWTYSIVTVECRDVPDQLETTSDDVDFHQQYELKKIYFC